MQYIRLTIPRKATIIKENLNDMIFRQAYQYRVTLDNKSDISLYSHPQGHGSARPSSYDAAQDPQARAPSPPPSIP